MSTLVRVRMDYTIEVAGDGIPRFPILDVIEHGLTAAGVKALALEPGAKVRLTLRARRRATDRAPADYDAIDLPEPTPLPSDGAPR